MPDSGALLQFVQRPNSVDLRVGERALRSRGRYSELVALYQGRGEHGAALALLETLSQRPDGLETPPQGAALELRGFPGVWAAVRYVSLLDARHAELVMAHARWILRADPEAGLEMFSAQNARLPPEVVVPVLAAYTPHLAVPYLEAALESGRADPGGNFEQQLAALYLDVLKEGSGGG
ncbi:hypothetical protein H632_c4947p0, partial [Helicosporidium sp. ATCC 50920]